MKKRTSLFIALAIVSSLILGGWLGGYVTAQGLKQRTSLYSGIRYSTRLINDVLIEVYRNYVEEVDPKDLIKSALNGMLSSLDPHSQYLDKDDYNELMIITRGEFGGLGIEISIRDRILTVISPIEGTPAYRMGIQAGDRIIEIEGESTEGITTEEAVKKLRGTPGTQVTITIDREGVFEPFEVTITRDIIKIDSVPYYGLIEDGIGYIRLANFSETSGEEIYQAIEELKSMGMEKLILDLRNNSGGVLDGAVVVADQFLPNGNLVVSTRGRIPSTNKEYRASHDLRYGTYPLIVLINGGTASGSEIVAGAVQDWDRGIILGTRSFGKGSVQTIISLDDGAVKLTTARYYTPSGRCIDQTTLGEADTTVTYYTLGGRSREVRGGGGITPDVVHEVPALSDLEVQLLTKTLYFKYSVKYIAAHKEEIDRSFCITEQIFQEFMALARDEGVEYTEEEVAESRENIERTLRTEIVAEKLGSKGRYENSLTWDPQVQHSAELLRDVSNTDELMDLVLGPPAEEPISLQAATVPQ